MGRYAMTYVDTVTFPQTVGITPIKLGYISAYTVTNGAEAEVGFNSLRCKVPGSYLVVVSVGLLVDTADNFYLSIYKNGLFTGYRNGAYIDTNGVGNISLHGIIEDLDVDDLLEVYVNSGTDASFAVTVASAQFGMVAA